jgi:hypothetical protein
MQDKLYQFTVTEEVGTGYMLMDNCKGIEMALMGW